MKSNFAKNTLFFETMIKPFKYQIDIFDIERNGSMVVFKHQM